MTTERAFPSRNSGNPTVLPDARRALRTLLTVFAAAAFAFGPPALCSRLHAQRTPVHYRHHAGMPPGRIGQEQLTRGGPLPGYFQPVQIKGPAGTMVSFAADGKFQQPNETPVTAEMLIGRVYRIKVTHIPLQEGMEIFPSIEVINRLYPPAGQRRRFPIQIELAEEDLLLALRGKYVVRVIYLEDPETALPFAEDPKDQR